jgi:hypothetical protein
MYHFNQALSRVDDDRLGTNARTLKTMPLEARAVAGGGGMLLRPVSL